MNTFIAIVIGMLAYMLLRMCFEFIEGNTDKSIFFLFSMLIIGGLVAIALLSINILGLG